MVLRALILKTIEANATSKLIKVDGPHLGDLGSFYGDFRTLISDVWG